ncbi:MAG: hypothetical protein KatS3mg098_103 [Candidatus Parcubacteria bacterium]|nr:hypothetical protein [Patescibacteria group bacterium]BCX15874.1 MAG: hypothetical protein KatS3mg098_103 [Candidatus Parcubacteria bacterium]
MKNKKELISIFFLVFFWGYLLLTEAARFTPQGPQNITGSPIEAPNQIWLMIYRIIGYVYTFFFLVAVLFIILAAYNFVFSRGDETKVKNAKNQIKWAIVAIVVALMSGGISILIQNFLLEGSGQMRFFLF